MSEYTIVMKRGTKKLDVVRKRDTWEAAFNCAINLAELHGLASPDVIEDKERKMFLLDASEWYDAA